ncbi:hypothetical protein HYW74_04615 [Candidatus Pacearchaeota archaeon]|nr:hypothetical protein [Candidatus Pacearchaeota archaeon]
MKSKDQLHRFKYQIEEGGRIKKGVYYVNTSEINRFVSSNKKVIDDAIKSRKINKTKGLLVQELIIPLWKDKVVYIAIQGKRNNTISEIKDIITMNLLQYYSELEFRKIKKVDYKKDWLKFFNDHSTKSLFSSKRRINFNGENLTKEKFIKQLLEEYDSRDYESSNTSQLSGKTNIEVFNEYLYIGTNKNKMKLPK